MKFFTNSVRYSILAGLAAYGVYHIVLNIIGMVVTLLSFGVKRNDYYSLFNFWIELVNEI